MVELGWDPALPPTCCQSNDKNAKTAKRKGRKMKRDFLFTTWVWALTSMMVGLVVLTNPIGSSPPAPGGAGSKPGCVLFGITNDVNNCGVLTPFVCRDMTPNPPPGPRNGQQCVWCRLGQWQIQGRQIEVKKWYDCNGDGIADCEIWWGWALPKCLIVRVTSIASTDCPVCPE